MNVCHITRTLISKVQISRIRYYKHTIFGFSEYGDRPVCCRIRRDCSCRDVYRRHDIQVDSATTVNYWFRSMLNDLFLTTFGSYHDLSILWRTVFDISTG